MGGTLRKDAVTEPPVLVRGMCLGSQPVPESRFCSPPRIRFPLFQCGCMIVPMERIEAPT